MASLIRQKHCLMCEHYIKSNIPKDKGTCKLFMKYNPYKQGFIYCDTHNFKVGGDNVIVFGKLISAVKPIVKPDSDN